MAGGNLSFGQLDLDSDTEKTKFYQIGLNVGPLWSNLINRDVRQPLFLFPILDTKEVLSFKLRKNKTSLRLGFGVNYINQKVEDNTSIQRNFLGRIGIEKQVDLTKKWQCFYGLDFKLKTGTVKESNDDDPYRWDGIGLSNFLGIQYRLTSRLILQTEASIQLSQTTIRNSNQFFIEPFPIFPIQTEGNKTTFKNLSLVIPNILYLAFEF